MKRLTADICLIMNFIPCVFNSGTYYKFRKFWNLCVSHLKHSLFSTPQKKDT